MASSPPSPSQIKEDGQSEHYYFLVATAAVFVLLVAYNMIMVGCFSRWAAVESIRRLFLRSGGIRNESIQKQIPACKYWKEKGKEQECSVCLSDFVDGEEIRQLPDCKHSFHPPCIDMWLYSHSNCPLCRANVVVPTQLRRELAAAAADDDDAESREGHHLSTSSMAGLIVVIL
ncbi:RING-H2 finger protein ATL16-like [Typha latifolia]|uniref:RING-H2 finger protein ATL16-like n=1 Tax=Typha latifolia TaxID=4733 RepID=UPI003C2EFB91